MSAIERAGVRHSETYRRVRIYAAEARASRIGAHRAPSLTELVLSFGPWWRSFRYDPLSRRAAPWITFPALRYLRRRIGPGDRVFEFGSGGSTIFFARHCADVCSIEHDPAWADRVRGRLDTLGMHNCVLRHVAPEPDPASASGLRPPYRSDAEGWGDVSFERYVHAIDEMAEQSLDVVLVDGRARADCLRRAIPKVKPGGMLLLDDSQRERYQAAMNDVPSGWVRHEFPGPIARTEFFTRTTIWHPPNTRAAWRR